MEGTKLFYEKESSRAMEKYYHKEKSFVTYLKHVSKLFEDELKYRVVLLHKTTEEKVLKVLSDTLVTKHLEIFDSEFKVTIIIYILSYYFDDEMRHRYHRRIV